MTDELFQSLLIWGGILEDLEAESVTDDRTERDWHGRAGLASIEHDRVIMRNGWDDDNWE